MKSVVIVIHLMIVLAMIGVVMLQKSEGGGLGMGGGGGFMTSRGTANVLTRTTAILALCFFLTSLLLSILAGYDRKPRSILPGSGGSAPISAPGGPLAPLDTGPLGPPPASGGGAPPAAPAPAAPAAPAEGGAPQVPRSQ
jgi:preprotein translocase subunit SecG